MISQTSVTRTSLALAALLMIGAGASPVSDLKPDEVVVFYPSYLTRNIETASWTGRIHGKVQESADGSSKHLKLAALRRILGIDGDLTEDQERLFVTRGSQFMVDNEKRKRIVVSIGDGFFVSDHSLANGHFDIDITWSGGDDGDALPFTARLNAGDIREFGGGLFLIGPAGISVISDIDDTVKESDVLDHDELMANTFLRPFRAVTGMPQLYEGWGDQGAVVHYVTGSPWQLYEPLWTFLEENGFPGVEIQMRPLRLKDRSIVNFFRKPRLYKSRRIREIMQRFPDRRFVLVGDSGERDPQVYASMARQYPDNVAGIFIRAVRDDHRDRSRYSEIFRGIDEEKWIIFRDPGELPADLVSWCGIAGN